MNEIEFQNTLVIANVIELVQATLRSADGAGFSIPDEMKDHPAMISEDIAKEVEVHINRAIVDHGRAPVAGGMQ